MLAIMKKLKNDAQYDLRRMAVLMAENGADSDEIKTAILAQMRGELKGEY